MNLENKIVPENVNTLSGEKEMQNLKHGQGTIQLRTKLRKNGTIYQWYQGTYKGINCTASNYTECYKRLATLRKNNITCKKKDKPKRIEWEDWLNKCVKVYKSNICPQQQRTYASVIKHHISENLRQKK